MFACKKILTGLIVGISPSSEDHEEYPEEELFTAVMVDMNRYEHYRFDFYHHELDSAKKKLHTKIKFIKFNVAYQSAVKHMYLYHQVSATHPAATEWCDAQVRDGFRADGWIRLHKPKNADVEVLASKTLTVG